MKPLRRPDHQTVYRGPRPEIGDLSCRRDEDGSIVSHWRPSADELAVLNAGGSIELTVWQEPIPPVAINTAAALEGEELGEHRLPNPGDPRFPV